MSEKFIAKKKNEMIDTRNPNPGTKSEKEEMADRIWELQCEVSNLRRLLETKAIKETAAYQQIQYNLAKRKLGNSFKVRLFEILYNACLRINFIATKVSIYLMERQLARLNNLKAEYPLAKDENNE